MAEEAATAAAPDVSGNIADSQVDKFFESGGNEDVLPQANETSESDHQDELQDTRPTQPEQTKQEKMVPYGAMHEERMRRQELQREIESYKQRTERMERTFQEVMQRTQPQERPPVFDEDPLEALRYNQNKQAEAVEFMYQTLEQQRAQAEHSQRLNAFKEMCDNSVQEFQKVAPDYQDAYRWLTENRLQEYETLGYDRKTAINLMIDDEKALAATAYRNGINPCERLYELAKHRGYKNQSTQASSDKFNQLERGMKASKSLGAPGGSAPQAMTLEALASMDDDDFDKNWEKIMRKFG